MTDDLERLYQTTYQAVVRFLYRKVWDADRAEDLAQEVFLRAMAHQPDKPRAWVFAVAANLARDEARSAVRRKRHLTLLSSDPAARPSAPAAPDDRVEHDERLEPPPVEHGHHHRRLRRGLHARRRGGPATERLPGVGVHRHAVQPRPVAHPTGAASAGG